MTRALLKVLDLTKLGEGEDSFFTSASSGGSEGCRLGRRKAVKQGRVTINWNLPRHTGVPTYKQELMSLTASSSQWEK